MLFEITITAAEVKAECSRRIQTRYSLGKQSTVALRGGSERDDMHAFIEGQIAASHRLEEMVPIPPDFTADHHWTDQPASSGLFSAGDE